jgi:hypothetical protein
VGTEFTYVRVLVRRSRQLLVLFHREDSDLVRLFAFLQSIKETPEAIGKLRKGRSLGHREEGLPDLRTINASNLESFQCQIDSLNQLIGDRTR